MAENGKQPGGEKQDRKPWTQRELGGKPVWDWFQLLIVPLALTALGFWFTSQQSFRQQKIEDQRAASDRAVEEQRAQQATLQAYLDQMATLLLDRNLRNANENSAVRRVARARTLVVLDALDSNRANRALRFLDETQLIQTRPPDRPPLISLKYASLGDFKLKGKQLLKGADLTQATITGGGLANADLEGTDLAGAHLGNIDLSGADLKAAKLSGAYLYDAHLNGADLSGADLSDAKGRFKSGARMSGAKLKGADLSKADLTNAQVTKQQLREAASLEGATMPNGQKYEDWLKDKAGRREDEE